MRIACCIQKQDEPKPAHPLSHHCYSYYANINTANNSSADKVGKSTPSHGSSSWGVPSCLQIPNWNISHCNTFAQMQCVRVSPLLVCMYAYSFLFSLLIISYFRIVILLDGSHTYSPLKFTHSQPCFSCYLSRFVAEITHFRINFVAFTVCCLI